ncbi:MAG: shikimate dehydrogenase [Eubacteriaceae bacterium]|nr:shikimate dehydrogenase [Eubacteriaceae bacterium]
MSYGLVGEKLGHSYSKIIHEKLGLYSYGLFEVPRSEFGAFIDARGYSGLNVTIPYKQEVISHLDSIDAAAKEIGAVNTLCFLSANGTAAGDILTGANTDYYGFLYMADRAGIDFAGQHVLVLGTGGASLMVQKAVMDKNAKSITVASRSQHAGVVTYDELSADSALRRSVGIIVNATPVGTYPDNYASVLDPGDYPSCAGVLDLIYNPFRTRLLLEAEAHHIPSSNGLPMLVAQAVKSAELWTGRKLMDKTAAIIAELKRELGNIVLTGMPGCGKSTVGRALADLLGRKMIDTDEEIEKRTGRHPAEIINEDGEAAFRKIETEIIRDICRENSLVISTGGGAVLRQENVDAMRQNGTVFFIERKIENLAADKRPLSGDLEKRRALYGRRLPMYMNAADHTVDNNGSVEKTAKAVIALLG